MSYKLQTLSIILSAAFSFFLQGADNHPSYGELEKLDRLCNAARAKGSSFIEAKIQGVTYQGCTLCHYIVTVPTEMKEHLKRHRERPSYAALGKAYRTSTDYQPEKHKKYISGDMNGTTYYGCALCKHVTHDKRDLNQHLTTHYERPTYGMVEQAAYSPEKTHAQEKEFITGEIKKCIYYGCTLCRRHVTVKKERIKKHITSHKNGTLPIRKQDDEALSSDTESEAESTTTKHQKLAPPLHHGGKQLALLKRLLHQPISDEETTQEETLPNRKRSHSGKDITLIPSIPWEDSSDDAQEDEGNSPLLDLSAFASIDPADLDFGEMTETDPFLNPEIFEDSMLDMLDPAFLTSVFPS